MKLREFDAFPKLEKNIQSTSSSGGFLTISVSIFLVYLSLHELWQFAQIRQKYEFLVDPTRSVGHNLQINIDMTVRMPCQCAILFAGEMCLIG